ncbi:MAG: nuclear transport factor 2 family protein [Rhizobiaceae bacterium]|nr:nuclear transport factor 2 family protein [Rhizobiaceae bacterium]
MTVEHDILARERARCEALRKADVAALDGLISERLVFMHANAKSDDKKVLLEKMRAGGIVYNSLDLSELNVTDLGDTALLHGRLTANVLVNGQPRLIDNQTLSVWAREAGTWRLVAYHPTPIPQAK